MTISSLLALFQDSVLLCQQRKCTALLAASPLLKEYISINLKRDLKLSLQWYVPEFSSNLYKARGRQHGLIIERGSGVRHGFIPGSL